MLKTSTNTSTKVVFSFFLVCFVFNFFFCKANFVFRTLEFWPEILTKTVFSSCNSQQLCIVDPFLSCLLFRDCRSLGPHCWSTVSGKWYIVGLTLVDPTSVNNRILRDRVGCRLLCTSRQQSQATLAFVAPNWSHLLKSSSSGCVHTLLVDRSEPSDFPRWISAKYRILVSDMLPTEVRYIFSGYFHA